MMNEQQTMDISPPFTPAGQYIDRSIASFTNGEVRSNYQKQLYKSTDMERYYYN